MVERHLGHALEVANDWLMVLEGRRVIYSNRGLLEALQVPSERVVGHNIEEVFPSGTCAGLDEFLEKLKKSGGRLVTDRMECDDAMLGSSALTVRGESRDGFTYLSLNRPLMDEKAYEERLMEVEDRLSAILGAAASAGVGLGVFEITPEGKYFARSMNEHMMAIFARSEEELLTTSPVEFLHPDDKPIALEAIKDAYATGTTAGPLDLRIIDGNGDIVHVRLTNTLLSLSNEKMLGVSFVLDMTTVKEALDQQNRMVQAIERIEETVVLADGDGGIFYANPAALRNSGYSLEEVIGRPISMFLAPEGGETLSQQATMEILKRGWWRGDVMTITKTGTRYPVEVMGSVVRDAKGEVSMFVAVSRKISERQRFEAQLVMAKSHHDRIQDLLEWELFPKLEETVERLQELSTSEAEPAGAEEIQGLAGELDEAFRSAKGVVAGLPPPERAEELMPANLAAVLSERLPAMAERYHHDGLPIDLDLQVPADKIIVMANTMLPDLIIRLLEVLLKKASMRKRTFTVAVGSGSSEEIPGTRVDDSADAKEASFATITITAPDLSVDDDLRSILTRQELRTRGPLPPDQSIAVETSRLLLFLFNGRIIIDTDEETDQQRVMIVLPMTDQS